MNDEVVVYLAVLAQRGNICKDGFGHTEQLHSLVYDVGAQVIGCLLYTSFFHKMQKEVRGKLQE